MAKGDGCKYVLRGFGMRGVHGQSYLQGGFPKKKDNSLPQQPTKAQWAGTLFFTTIDLDGFSI